MSPPQKIRYRGPNSRVRIIRKACYEYGDIVVYGLLSGLMLAGEFTAEACAEAILALIEAEVKA